MPSGPNQQPLMQEQALLNHVKRLERAGGDYCAVQMHLSKLNTFHRLPECLKVVSTMMARDAKKIDASLFNLFNSDIFLVFPRDAAQKVQETLDRICQVLGEDPFFSAGDSTRSEFNTYYDLDDHFPELVTCVEALVQARMEHDLDVRAKRKANGAGKPLDPTNLAAIEKAITQADLSSMTSRQAICEVSDDGRAKPLFYELFTSIGALQKTLLPD